MNKLAILLAGLALVALVNAECPNACSGHGTCGCKDQCSCYKNWQGNDCSEATCYFGLAHVDSPKGNLDGDADGALDTTANIVGNAVYTMGTIEKYPTDLDTNEGHYYMECSNKGLCDRETGLCSCFPGYEGSACKRASCPNSCSGHGTCESIKEMGLADWTLHADYSGAGTSSYSLWDADIGFGCACDAGYHGADCSLRKCKYGVDPLYFSQEMGQVVIDTAIGGTGLTGTLTFGFYAHNATASTGTLYTTSTFAAADYASATAVAQCDSLITTLLAATDENSNTVSASDLKGLTCEQKDTFTAGDEGSRFIVKFDANPGLLTTLHVYTNAAVDGSNAAATVTVTYRPIGTCVSQPVFEEAVILVSDSSAAAVGDYRLKFFDVFGEDYITEPITVTKLSALSGTEDVCNGVVSKLMNLPNGVISDVHCRVQKTSSGNVQHGAAIYLTFYKNPGVLKPIEVYETNVAATTSVTVGSGHSSGEFVDRLTSKAMSAASANAYVLAAHNGETTFTTSVDATTLTGVMLIKVQDRHMMQTGYSNPTVTVAWAYTGQDVMAASEEVQVFYSADTWAAITPTIASWAVGASSFTTNADASSDLTKGSVIFTYNQYFTVQFASPSTPWTVYVDRPFGGAPVASGQEAATDLLAARTDGAVYKRTATGASTYSYISPCSNRGTCDSETGVCTCFRGYSGDECGIQNVLMA